MNFFNRIFARDAGATLTRRAPSSAVTSWNAEARTFEAVLSTGAAVERHDTRGAYDEVLDVRAAQLPQSVPLLDSHARDSIDRVIGTVANLRVENGELRGLVTLSRHNPQALRIAGEISDGARYGVSIGYAVSRWADRTNGDRRERVASQWQLLEASLVAVPADPGCGLRGDDRGQDMNRNTNAAPVERENPNRAGRAQEIRTIASVAGLPPSWADGHVDAGSAVEAVRSAALREMHQRSAPVSQMGAVVIRENDDQPGRVAAMGEALYARVTPSHRPSDRARQYVGMTIPDLARECLRVAGVQTTGLSPNTVIERALHTTSDFPELMADTVGRTLRAAYTAAPSPLRALARQRTAVDFRAMFSVGMSAGGFKLLPTNEAGEFREGTITEGVESFKIDTYGRIFSISRQALVNDRLGAFADLPRQLGQAAVALESDVIVSVLLANPILSDGLAVFHASHGNVGTPGAISLTTLSEARVLMRHQKGLGGELLNLRPAYLVVAVEQETLAEQVLTTIAATQPADVNPLAGRLQLVVDPRLPAGAWYVVSADADALQFATLEGEDGPQVVTQQGFDVDGVRIRVRHDFGAGWLDYRSWVKNTGA
jgi:HK97 family phage prohead protease